MPTTATECVLFLSSFAPLFVVFGLLESFGAGWPSYVCYAVAVVSAVALFGMIRSSRRLSPIAVELVQARPRDTDAIGYLATYVVPFAALGVEDWRSRCALLVFLVLVGVLYVRAHLFYVNPLLSIAGYRLFEGETSTGRPLLVLTKRKFVSMRARIDLFTLSDYVYLEDDAGTSKLSTSS